MRQYLDKMFKLFNKLSIESKLTQKYFPANYNDDMYLLSACTGSVIGAYKSYKYHSEYRFPVKHSTGSILFMTSGYVIFGGVAGILFYACYPVLLICGLASLPSLINNKSR